MNPRRHQNDTKTFAELTFEEQAKAMNMNALQFRAQLRAHLRRAAKEARPRREVLNTRLNLLRNILDEYADQAKEPMISIKFSKGSGAVSLLQTRPKPFATNGAKKPKAVNHE